MFSFRIRLLETGVPKTETRKGLRVGCLLASPLRQPRSAKALRGGESASRWRAGLPASLKRYAAAGWPLIFAFSSHATILFHSDFECGNTYLARKLKPGAKTIHLMINHRLTEWPAAGGNGIVEGNLPSSAETFTYEQRKGNRLFGVSGISRRHVAGTPVQTGNLREWNDPSPVRPEVVRGQSLHGHHSTRFDCAATSSMLIVQRFPKTGDTIHCRFYFLLEKGLHFGEGYREVSIMSLRFKDSRFPKLAIISEAKTNRQIFTFSQHMLSAWTANAKRMLVPKRVELTSGLVYCLEYRVIAGPHNRFAVRLLVNGVPQEEIQGTINERVPMPNHLSIGKFGPIPAQGTFLMDEVVISTNPIGTLPQKPELRITGSRLSTSSFSDVKPSARHRASHWQINPANSWLLPLFNSGENREHITHLPFPYAVALTPSMNLVIPLEKAIRIPTGLKPNEKYFGRVRHQSSDGCWSKWSEPQSFVCPPPPRTSPRPTSGLPKVKSAFFAKTGSRKPVRIVEKNVWYDLCMEFEGEGIGSNPKNRFFLDVFLNGDPENLAAHHAFRGEPFRAKSNYFLSIAPALGRVYARENEGAEISTSYTSKRGVYCDVSDGSFHYDSKANRIRMPVRLLAQAVSGPWSLNAYCQSKHNGMSPLYSQLFHVRNKQLSRAPKSHWPGTITLASLLCALSVMIGFFLGRSRNREAPTESQSQIPLNSDDSHSHRIQMACEFVLQNFHKPISTRDVARAVNITPNHLSSIFRQSTGKTLVDYINEIRIGEAKKHLSGSALRVSEIAYKCGYKTLTNFRKSFLKQTGISPTQYRESA